MYNKCFNCEACLSCNKKKGHCQCTKFNTYRNEIMTFGKYKGLTFKDIKSEYPDYLIWLSSNMPKHRMPDKLYYYIKVNSDEIAMLAKKKRRI
jgi:uncharacterized protein (DUF3820 family)